MSLGQLSAQKRRRRRKKKKRRKGSKKLCHACRRGKAFHFSSILFLWTNWTTFAKAKKVCPSYRICWSTSRPFGGEGKESVWPSREREAMATSGSVGLMVNWERGEYLLYHRRMREGEKQTNRITTARKRKRRSKQPSLFRQREGRMRKRRRRRKRESGNIHCEAVKFETGAHFS